MTESILAHLALSLNPHPENIATEALGYILKRSVDAREALLAFLTQAGIHIEGPLTFRTQAVGTSGDRPDLVAIDAKSNEALLIEVKFWAGLTENQPGAYLKRGTLLVVCPAQRVNFLWSELGRLCAADGHPLTNPRLALRDTWIAEVETQKWLAITSWRELLSEIGSRLDRRTLNGSSLELSKSPGRHAVGFSLYSKVRLTI
jgi:hypothetical protein